MVQQKHFYLPKVYFLAIATVKRGKTGGIHYKAYWSMSLWWARSNCAGPQKKLDFSYTPVKSLSMFPNVSLMDGFIAKRCDCHTKEDARKQQKAYCPIVSWWKCKKRKKKSPYRTRVMTTEGVLEMHRMQQANPVMSDQSITSHARTVDLQDFGPCRFLIYL